MALQLQPARMARLLAAQPAEPAQPAGLRPAPEPATVVGPGGQRMTPAEITIARELARKKMAAGADYSPVQHWTQGLARVADGLFGALDDRRARKAADVNAAEGDAVMQALMSSSDPATSNGSDSGDAILAALMNPYVSDQVRGVAGKMWDRDYEANKPQYFNSGNDRVMFDPRTSQSSVLYQGQSDAEDYAASLGYQPGTPDFTTAMQDYVLRANGPTAFEYDLDLEGARQGNRESLEDRRYRNRLSLRQTPTYGQTHPRTPQPRSGGGGGGSRGPTTMSAVIAPILAKVAAGKQLTPAEQQAYSMYRPGRGGSGGGGSQPSAAPRTATDPKTGKKVQWNGKAWVPAG